MYKISILGCGWLGSKIASYLIKTGNTVSGSTTSVENSDFLSSMGIKPYCINIKETVDLSVIEPSFFNCNTLIVSLKPNRREFDGGYFVNQINVCADLAKKYGIKQLIFISSTSVYGNQAQIAVEENELNPTMPSGISLKLAEINLQNTKELNTTILRLGGLIGYDRNPFEAITKQKRTGSLYVPVNLVHADDVAIIAQQIIEKKIYNETFNIVADQHPLRIEYYKHTYNQTGIVPTNFDNKQNLTFKIVDNSKIKRALSYEFRLKNPVDLYNYSPLITTK